MRDETSYERLLEAVIARPADPVPRTALADWLSRHGRPEEAAEQRAITARGLPVGMPLYDPARVYLEFSAVPDRRPTHLMYDVRRNAVALAAAIFPTDPLADTDGVRYWPIRADADYLELSRRARAGEIAHDLEQVGAACRAGTPDAVRHADEAIRAWLAAVPVRPGYTPGTTLPDFLLDAAEQIRVWWGRDDLVRLAGSVADRAAGAGLATDGVIGVLEMLLEERREAVRDDLAEGAGPDRVAVGMPAAWRDGERRLPAVVEGVASDGWRVRVAGGDSVAWCNWDGRRYVPEGRPFGGQVVVGT